MTCFNMTHHRRQTHVGVLGDMWTAHDRRRTIGVRPTKE